MNMYVIGVDDHDSPEGGCTTHFSSLLLKEFNKANVRVVGYPRLTRLNPNIPWKTRGNASVSFVVETERDQAELLEMVWSESMNY
ncbi:MAG: tRNA(Ile2) 2-agmatinylcytidine synthetase TiaS, partial [Metallosphaera sp.]